MPVEMAIWRMTDAGPVPITYTPLGLERRLEDMIGADPSLIGVELLVVGRQVRTDFGGIIDVLALDSDAHVHVLELKRDRTPRDIVAQALDYGSWAQGLVLDQSPPSSPTIMTRLWTKPLLNASAARSPTCSMRISN
jgi:hypothetical protein